MQSSLVDLIGALVLGLAVGIAAFAAWPDVITVWALPAGPLCAVSLVGAMTWAKEWAPRNVFLLAAAGFAAGAVVPSVMLPVGVLFVASVVWLRRNRPDLFR
jgi:hypothetical protein